MRSVIEQYGMGILELIATVGILVIIFACTGKNGAISNIVAHYFESICG